MLPPQNADSGIGGQHSMWTSMDTRETRDVWTADARIGHNRSGCTQFAHALTHTCPHLTTFRLDNRQCSVRTPAARLVKSAHVRIFKTVRAPNGACERRKRRCLPCGRRPRRTSRLRALRRYSVNLAHPATQPRRGCTPFLAEPMTPADRPIRLARRSRPLRLDVPPGQTESAAIAATDRDRLRSHGAL